MRSIRGQGVDIARRLRQEQAMNAIARNDNTPAACPICGKPRDEAFRPFCSKRCADIDLNRWLSGVYAVPVTEEEDEDGARPAEPGEGQDR